MIDGRAGLALGEPARVARRVLVLDHREPRRERARAVLDVGQRERDALLTRAAVGADAECRRSRGATSRRPPRARRGRDRAVRSAP